LRFFVHRLLERQLKFFFGSLENVPDEWKPLLEEVSTSYEEAEQERAILEKTLREEMEKSQRASTIPNSGTSYQYQGNFNEPDPKHSPERPNARAKGKTVLRKVNAKDTNGGSRVAVPIKLREQTLGVLNLSFENAETAQQNAPLLEQLSSRLALAMDNARLFAETQISLTRTNALLKVSRAAVAFEDISELSQSLVDSIAETLPADRVSLISFDLNQKQIAGFYAGGPGAGQIIGSITFDELIDGLSGWVIQEKKPALSPKYVPDSRESAEVQERRRETNCGSVLVVPLLYRGQITSTLTAINTPEQHDFTEQDAELMMAMASQGATAIENARLFQIQQRRAAELQAAAEISHAASSILELDQLLEQTVEVIRERFGLYYVGIFLVDETGDWAELRAGTGEAGRIQIERQHKLHVGGESMIGQCVATSTVRISLDVGGESLRFKNPILPDTRSDDYPKCLARRIRPRKHYHSADNGRSTGKRNSKCSIV
jgi:GAF domain-containing protein